MPVIRIGNGFDAHRFTDGRPLILGGVNIEYARGMEAHSDGDVVIHALCDAMLGAVAQGDIGRHFPDSDAQFANADSRKLLRHVNNIIRENGYALGNADLTIIAQAPKLSPYIDVMRETLANDLSVETNLISIKATTTEKMGFTGRGEGIAVLASVILTHI